MKQALLITSSLVLLSLVPAAAADISVLGGTAVIHTDGDLGISALGEPVARLDPESPCYNGDATCTIVYGNPAGVGDYVITASIGPCEGWEVCILAGVLLPSGAGTGAGLLVNEGLTVALVCAVADCLYVNTDPICISDALIGEIVCET